jgi:hypothetical protein
MRKIIALALLFVLSFANFGQTITLQTQKKKPTTTVKTQKVKPKAAAKTQKVKPKTAATTQKAKPKANKTTAQTKPKTEQKVEITTIPAKTTDGKDIILKEDGTWAYKKPEPTPKPSPVAKTSPTPKSSPVAKVTPIATPTPTPVQIVIAKPTPTPVIKPNPTVNPSPVAKSTPAPKTKAFIESKICELTLQDSPQIRGLKLGMPRTEADGIIPGDRVRIINSSDIISYPQFSKARGFETVYQISAEFLENRLSLLEIVYDTEDVKWKSAKEFAAALSTNFNIPSRFWKYNARNQSVAEMQCREFSIKIDSSTNELSLQKMDAPQKTAQGEKSEKSTFKP